MKQWFKAIVELVTYFVTIALLLNISLNSYNYYNSFAPIEPQWVEYFDAAKTNCPVTLTLHHVSTPRNWEFQVRILDGKHCITTFHAASYVREISSFSFSLTSHIKKLGNARKLTIECSAPYEYYTIEVK